MQQLYLNNFFYKDPTTGEFVPIAGIAGESAYEIAVRLGTFTGTEEEWNNYIAIERDKAIADIIAKATEAKESIPDDYTALSEKLDSITESETVKEWVDLFGDYTTEIAYLGKISGVEQQGLYWNGAGEISTEPSASGFNACSARIDVESNKVYRIKNAMIITGFDANDNFVTKMGAHEFTTYSEITIPEGVSGVRLSFKMGDRVLPIIEGEIVTNVTTTIKPEAVAYKLDKKMGNENANKPLFVNEDGDIAPKETIIVSKNLFDKSTATTAKTVYLGKDKNGNEMNGWYLTGAGTVGTAASGSGVDSVSARIEVEGGKTYWKTNTSIVNAFDSEDKHTGYVSGMEAPLAILPENAKYVRISFISRLINHLQFTEGETQIPYDEFAKGIEKFATKQYADMSTVLYRNALGREYMSAYSKKIADEANKYVRSNRHTFLAITDTHSTILTAYVASIAANMTKYVPCSYIAHCGDIIDGVKDKEYEMSCLTELVRNFNDAKCPVYYVKGNHDDGAIGAGGDENKTTPDKYISNAELSAMTNGFAKRTVVFGSHENMYFYVDDEETKIRTIFLNSFEVPEDVDENGNRKFIAYKGAPVFSREQIEWFANSALNFVDKGENKVNWGVITVSHRVSGRGIFNTVNAFASGTTSSPKWDNINGVTEIITVDYTEQGPMEFIAYFVGDDHYDALVTENATLNAFPVIKFLNASTAQDNTNVPTATNGVLMPPPKTIGTENETAFDIVTIDRSSKRIYLTRYGARSYAYNSDTGAFDKIAARTRVIDYENVSYTVLTE